MANFNPNHIIHVLAPANPKRPGTQSHQYWGLYKTGQTVAEFAAAHKKAGAGFTPGAVLTWDSHPKRAFIAVLPPGEKPKLPAPKK